MVQTVKNAIVLLPLLLKVFQNLRTQTAFLQVSIEREITQFNFTDQSVKPDDLKKIRKYYALAVPAILGEGYALLRGQPLSKNDRQALTYLGAVTGLFDDLFDEHSASPDHIRQLFETVNPELAQNDHERLFVLLFKKARSFIDNEDTLLESARKVHRAQIASMEQAGSAISRQRIAEITREKGGQSLLFYRSAFHQRMQAEERHLLFELGALMQLENDIFDVYKDHKQDIRTLATTTKKIQHLRNTYLEGFNKTISSLYKTHFAYKHKKQFLRYISLIICRGLVCLDCLEENQKQSKGLFDLDAYTRKQLICDMEKPINIIRTARYFTRCKFDGQSFLHKNRS